MLDAASEQFVVMGQHLIVSNIKLEMISLDIMMID